MNVDEADFIRVGIEVPTCPVGPLLSPITSNDGSIFHHAVHYSLQHTAVKLRSHYLPHRSCYESKQTKRRKKHRYNY